MPKPCPREFREDVVRVARNREPGVHLKQIAAGFGISQSWLANWLKAADVEDGGGPGTTAADSAELREARKRIRLLEQGQRGPAAGGGLPVAGQPAGRRLYPLVSEFAADGIGVTVTCRVRALAQQFPCYRWRARPVTDTELEQAHRADALFDAHRADRRVRAPAAG